MWVDVGEIELSGEQEDDGTDGGKVAVAARHTLGDQEQAVDGFEEAIGLSGPSQATKSTV